MATSPFNGVAPFAKPSLQQKFVAAILQLISAAELEAIVEGIETPGQAASLQAMGCLYGQGYYFGRPVPAAEILPRISHSEPQM